MSALGTAGIPTLVVMDSKGKIITTSARGAVTRNPEGCVQEWLQGNPGAGVIGRINWMSILLYVLIVSLGWWWLRSRGAST